MKKHMQHRILAAAAVSAVVFCAGTAVYAFQDSGVINRFHTGSVNIRLKEYMMSSEGIEEEFTDLENILPGRYISKIPRIFNEGAECYVRVKINYSDPELTRDENLRDMPEKWYKAADGYYYLTESLKSGENVDVFHGIEIPTDLSQEQAQEKTIRVSIEAEAIQAAGFTPDYQSDAPWGNVEILDAVGTENEFKGIVPEKETLIIEYRDGAEELFINPEDFFKNQPDWMPGESYTDTVILRNSGKKSIKLYFRNEKISDEEILNKIGLTITVETSQNRSLLYNGNLGGDETGKTILLGEFLPEQTGKFIFTIKIPKELDNRYSNIKSSVKWIFSADYAEVPVTGDVFSLSLLTVISCVAASILIFVLYLHRLYRWTGKKRRKGGIDDETV